jgi:hypothetical protein
MKALAEPLFTIVFFIVLACTVFWAIHFLTGWTPTLRH